MNHAVRKVGKTNAPADLQGSLGEKIVHKDKVFILFYATWCPFSQHFLPIFEEYQEHNPDECLSVIVDEEPELCEQYDIELYPTVLMTKHGKVHKRLDSEPHVYLTKAQLEEFTRNDV